MNRRVWGCLVPVILVLVATVWCFWPTKLPLAPNTDTWSAGYLIEGSKFGVSVGSRMTPPQQLRGMTLVFEPVDCQQAVGDMIRCEKGTRADIYVMNEAIGRGTFYIVRRGQLVTALVWKRTMLPLIDT